LCSLYNNSNNAFPQKIAKAFLYARHRALFRHRAYNFFYKKLPVVCSLKMHRMREICRFTGRPTAKTLSASGGLCPLTPTRGSAPGPRWGLCPQTPFIGSRFTLAMGLSPLNSRSWLRPCCRFMLLIFVCDLCQTDYVNVYSTDLYEICRISRTLSVTN